MLTESANHLAVFLLDRFHRRSTSQKRVLVTLAMCARFGLVGWSTGYVLSLCTPGSFREHEVGNVFQFFLSCSLPALMHRSFLDTCGRLRSLSCTRTTSYRSLRFLIVFLRYYCSKCTGTNCSTARSGMRSIPVRHVNASEPKPECRCLGIARLPG